MKVYLCGGMHNGWQDEAIKLLNGHTVLDPRSHGIQDERAYTEWDLNAIRACDCVLAYMDLPNPSGYGLSLEIGFAHALNKPIYLAIEYLGCRDRYFGMARSVSQCYSSLQDAVRAINA